MLVPTVRVNGLAFDSRETLLPVLRWPACVPVGAGDTSRH